MVQVHELTERLKSDELTVADLMQVFVAAATREVMMSQLDCAVGELQSFSEREHIIRDAINAHFDGKYSLSVPVGFLLLEGVLRSLGGLTLKEDLAVSIPRDRWENRLAPEIQARADSFRSFVTNIFKGSQDVGTFNRNPVLHGAAVDYHREDWSLMLLMSLFEIRMFMFYRKFPETIT
jgi:hypothetical protein